MLNIEHLKDPTFVAVLMKLIHSSQGLVAWHRHEDDPDTVSYSVFFENAHITGEIPYDPLLPSEYETGSREPGIINYRGLRLFREDLLTALNPVQLEDQPFLVDIKRLVKDVKRMVGKLHPVYLTTLTEPQIAEHAILVLIEHFYIYGDKKDLMSALHVVGEYVHPKAGTTSDQTLIGCLLDKTLIHFQSSMSLTTLYTAMVEDIATIITEVDTEKDAKSMRLVYKTLAGELTVEEYIQCQFDFYDDLVTEGYISWGMARFRLMAANYRYGIKIPDELKPYLDEHFSNWPMVLDDIEMIAKHSSLSKAMLIDRLVSDSNKINNFYY